MWGDDDWWHLATGRLLATTRALPTTDPLSFTATGQPWHGIPWLTDLVFYGAWASFGFVGLSLVKVLAAALTLGALTKAFEAFGAKGAARLAVLPLVAVVLQSRHTRLRPEIFGVAFVVLLAFVLASFWMARARKPHLWLLVPLLWVWSTVHTSVALGAVLTAATLVLALARADLRRVSLWGWAYLGIGLFPLVGTAFGRGVAYAIWMGNRANSPITYAATSEWVRPAWTSPERLLVTACWIAAAALAFTAGRRRALALAGVFAAAGAALMWSADRHLGFGVVLGAPLLALGVDGIAARLEKRPAAFCSVTTGGLGLALAVAFLLAEPAVKNRTWFGSGLAPGVYPETSLALLRKLPEGHLLHELHDGGWLMWENVPGGVYIDGRTVHLYTDDDVKRLLLDPATQTGVLEANVVRWNIRYALVGGLWTDAITKSPEWIPILHERASSLFVRRTAVEGAVAAGAVSLDPLRFSPDGRWMEVYYGPILAHPPSRKALMNAARRANALFPDNPVLVHVGEFLFQFDRAAFDEYLRAVQGA
jgi:hypothetical protein